MYTDQPTHVLPVLTHHVMSVPSAVCANTPRRVCPQCSLRVCYGDSAFNRREIADFQKSIGHRGATVACYYDPEHVSSGAVLHVIPAGSHVLHALLWPTAASVVGVAACVVFCRWCRRQESASARKTSHVALRTTTTTITLGGPDTPLETTRVVFDDCRTPSCDSTVDQWLEGPCLSVCPSSASLCQRGHSNNLS